MGHIKSYLLNKGHTRLFPISRSGFGYIEQVILGPKFSNGSMGDATFLKYPHGHCHTYNTFTHYTCSYTSI